MVEFIINQSSFYCIWFTGNTDGFITEKGRLKYFYDNSELKDYCNTMKINLQNSETRYDLDRISDKVFLDISEKDCCELIDCWNIFSDIARSVNEDFYGNKKELNDLYSKLFYGCNLQIINTSNKKYIPEWSEEERTFIDNIMINGINIVKKSFNIPIRRKRQKISDMPLDDAIINNIRLIDNYAVIEILLYNEKRVTFKFFNCWRLISRQAVDQEIGDYKILKKSELLDEVADDILNGDGTIDELKNAEHIMFYEPWNENVILEIVYDGMEIE